MLAGGSRGIIADPGFGRSAQVNPLRRRKAACWLPFEWSLSFLANGSLTSIERRALSTLQELLCTFKP